MDSSLDPLRRRRSHPQASWLPLPTATDDECLRQLAAAVETHDAHKLAEVAGLIGRLAVPIE
ncbi:MAG: hypothetical protein JSS22_10330 [Proteobacteria bacterium]|nr:hypothetical protein [Pseudomonadota bacterium]